MSQEENGQRNPVMENIFKQRCYFSISCVSAFYAFLSGYFFFIYFFFLPVDPIQISMVPFWCLSFFLEEKQQSGYPIIDEPHTVKEWKRAKHKKYAPDRCEGITALQGVCIRHRTGWAAVLHPCNIWSWAEAKTAFVLLFFFSHFLWADRRRSIIVMTSDRVERDGQAPMRHFFFFC